MRPTDDLEEVIRKDLSFAADAELHFAIRGNTETFTLLNLVFPVDAMFFGVSTNGVTFNGYQIFGPTGDWIPVNLDLADDPQLGNFTDMTD